MNARKKKVSKVENPEPSGDLFNMTFDEVPARAEDYAPLPPVIDVAQPDVLPGNLPIGLEARIQGRDE